MRIDFHTHILPAVDDGSHSFQESLAMLRQEQEQNVDLVVLTPHFYAAENDVETFLKRREASWQHLQPHLTADLPRTCLGAEVQYFEGIVQTENIFKLGIEGSHLFLLEMPFSKWSKEMIRDILALNGTAERQVVLAHIERYLPYQTEKVWDLLLENHVLMQCNASFFQNWRTKHQALSMLRRGRIHMVASDCHDQKVRVPNLKKAYEIIGAHTELLRTEL